MDRSDSSGRRRYWPKGKGKRSNRRATRADRQREALEWRKQGLDYYVIGEKMGVSHTTAMRYIQGALEEIAERKAEIGEDVLQMELERLDRFLNALWPSIEKGDQGAIEKGIRVMERRSRYLGLDAPEKKAHEGKDGRPIQVVFYEEDENL